MQFKRKLKQAVFAMIVLVFGLYLIGLLKYYADRGVVDKIRQKGMYMFGNNTLSVLKAKSSINLSSKTNLSHLAQFVPSVSKDRTDNITNKYLELPKMEYTTTVAILTPVRNAKDHIINLQSQIKELTYPHRLISVFFGEDSSNDDTFTVAKEAVTSLVNTGFHGGEVFHFNITGGVDGSWADKHKQSEQRSRRSHMAKARNMLAKAVLEINRFNYFLWIDSDVKTLPSDLVEQLLFAKSDVAVTACMYLDKEVRKNYDLNSWRETNMSRELEVDANEDTLIIEGYGKSKRIMLPDLKDEGRFVSLDGVGACALMIKAECFKAGLKFPEVIYKHHIESEGLAKLAKDMNFSVVGLPYVEVVHS